MTSPSEVQSADELDSRGLQEVRIMTDAMRTHSSQVSELAKRRKALILRLRKQRITYREIANSMGVTTQLVYKIIKDDLDREAEYTPEGKRIRYRGRPLMTQDERVAKAQAKLDLEKSRLEAGKVPLSKPSRSKKTK